MNNDVISRSALLSFPIRANHYDEKNGDINFILGIETVMEYVEALPSLNVAPEWISVKDRLPEERDSIFAKLYDTDKWKKTMFRRISADVLVVREYDNGTRWVHYDHTVDGKWASIINKYPGNFRITHWMPLPEPPSIQEDCS